MFSSPLSPLTPLLPVPCIRSPFAVRLVLFALLGGAVRARLNSVCSVMATDTSAAELVWTRAVARRGDACVFGLVL